MSEREEKGETDVNLSKNFYESLKEKISQQNFTVILRLAIKELLDSSRDSPLKLEEEVRVWVSSPEIEKGKFIKRFTVVLPKEDLDSVNRICKQLTKREGDKTVTRRSP